MKDKDVQVRGMDSVRCPTRKMDSAREMDSARD
jgi:hypothetical protein